MKFCKNCGAKIIDDSKFCGQCGETIESAKPEIKSESFEDKRELVSGGTKKSSPKFYVNLVLLVLFSGSIFYYFATNKSKEEEIIDNQPQVTGSVEYPESRFDMNAIEYTAEDGYVVLSLNEVLDKKFVRFVYKSSLREIPMLAYISEDGNLVTSISMCEPCNSTTFHITGDELVCNSCGSTWELNSLEEVSGSCGKYPPDPIPSRVSGNKILIPVDKIESWRRRV